MSYERSNYEETSTESEIKTRINSRSLRKIFMEKLEDLRRGTIDLNIYDTSSLWSEMFKERNIIFLRCTSMISPETWEDAFMDKYANEQRRAVTELRQLRAETPSKYEEIVRFIRAKLGATGRFAEDWIDSVEDVNFKRIFIIKNEQIANVSTLVKLCELISSQATYMDVKFTYEGMELPATSLRDFAIAVSKEGDIFIYDLFCPRDRGARAHVLRGGRISFDPTKVREAIQDYGRFRGQTTDVAKNCSQLEVLDLIIEKTKAYGAKIDDKTVQDAKSELERRAMERKRKKTKIKLHRCAHCFIESEVTLGNMQEVRFDDLPSELRWIERVVRKNSGMDWKDFPKTKRMWYQMIDAENKAILDLVEKTGPERIIEVGCGPGRLISQILKKNYKYTEMVGMDADPLMAFIAKHRFREHHKINISGIAVEKELPYRDNYFDLCINAMNIVGWQADERAWLKEMLRCSKVVFLTLYKKGQESQRQAMYQTRGHSQKKVYLDSETKQIQLQDCDTNRNVISRAYSRAEVESMFKDVKLTYEPDYNVEYDIDPNINKLLHFCTLTKRLKKTQLEHTIAPESNSTRSMSTGISELDAHLRGGIPIGNSVVLTCPSIVEKDLLVKGFVEAGVKNDETVILCTLDPEPFRSLLSSTNLHLFACGPYADIKDREQVARLRGIENLNAINTAILSKFRKLGPPSKPRRAALDIVSDIVSYHKPPKTRRWLKTMLPRLKENGFTTLVILDVDVFEEPQDLNVVCSSFNGEVSMKKGKKRSEFLVEVKKMQSCEYIEGEFTMKL